MYNSRIDKDPVYIVLQERSKDTDTWFLLIQEVTKLKYYIHISANKKSDTHDR